MGNVVQNDPHITKRAEDQTRRSAFKMSKSVILSDTVDERLAKAFLVQARDPTFDGQWGAYIQKQALRLIRLRLHDNTYRSLVPANAIHLWPRKNLLTGNTEAYTMIEIAETIMKLNAPEAAPQTKSIDQRCREAAFAYLIDDQNIEEKYWTAYLILVDHNYLAAEMTPDQNDRLANELYKKLPKNTGMAKLFTEKTGLDTVDQAVYRIKALLAQVRQAIRMASSYGPEYYDYKIDSRDKGDTNSSSTFSSSSSLSSSNPPTSAETKRIKKRSSADCKPPPYADKSECCGGWGHTRSHCRWATHTLASNTNKSWKN